MKVFIRLILILFLFGSSFSYSKTILEMSFSNVKLSTVISALMKLAGKNYIFDPDASDILSKNVDVNIQSPVRLEDAINALLDQYGLIAAQKDKNLYLIGKSASLTINLKGMSEKDRKDLIDFVKSRTTPSAYITYDKILDNLYVKDYEKKIKELENALKEFYTKLQTRERVTEEEVPTTKVFYIDYAKLEDAKKLIQPILSKDAVVTESTVFNALIITDKPSKLREYERVLSKLSARTPEERKPVTKILYLKYITPDEFIKLIQPILSESGTILSGGALKTETQQTTTPQGQQVTQTTTQVVRQIPVIKEFNAIMLTDYPEVFEKIKSLYKDYVSETPPQVRIEARIVEVREEVVRQLGLGLSLNMSNVQVPSSWSGGVSANTPVYPPNFPEIGAPPSLLPTPGLSTAPGSLLVFRYAKGQINPLLLRLSAYEKLGQVKNLARPSVVTINGQTAIIKQGQEIPYQTALATGGSTTVSYSFKEVVLALEVTPIIAPDDRILLDIKIKQDTPQQTTIPGVPPAINKREASARAIVKDGDTIIIGGIIQQQDSKTNEGVPGLVRVPILKYLFGQENLNLQNTELLIFITPTIITQ